MATATIPTAEVVSFLTADLLTTQQVAGLLGITKKALADWRVKQDGPPFVTLKRGVPRYPLYGVRRFLRARVSASPATSKGRNRRIGGFTDATNEADSD